MCGGAIGNLIDRIRSPAGVVDFIDVGVGDLRWPTFNVADMAVSVGAFLLAWVLWGEETISRARRWLRAPTPVSDSAAGDLALSDAREFLVEADGNVRLDLLIAHRAELSRTQAATLIAQGHVTGRMGGAKKPATARSRARSFVVDEPQSRETEIIRGRHSVSVVYEDESLLVVDKPAGMVVHPAPGTGREPSSTR